jgi:5-methylcytosine-specific restriction endonuclease McrA
MKMLLFPKVLSLSLFIALAISFESCAENLTRNPLVKQSSSGICHDKSSGSFNRTKNYISFDTIAACIDAGGRLPKGKTY